MVYEGSFKNGIKHGTGKHTQANGCEYEGSWKSMKFHGIGKYVYADGRIYKGVFKNGAFLGTGTLTYPLGTIIEIKDWRQKVPGMSKKKHQQKRRVSKDSDMLIAEFKKMARETEVTLPEIKMPEMNMPEMNMRERKMDPWRERLCAGLVAVEE
eukprot:COSAG02_NODE_10850_length_1846_cov_1.447624_3_plen_154_part_00